MYNTKTRCRETWTAVACCKQRRTHVDVCCHQLSVGNIAPHFLRTLHRPHALLPTTSCKRWGSCNTNNILTDVCIPFLYTTNNATPCVLSRAPYQPVSSHVCLVGNRDGGYDRRIHISIIPTSSCSCDPIHSNITNWQKRYTEYHRFTTINAIYLRRVHRLDAAVAVTTRPPTNYCTPSGGTELLAHAKV